MASFRPSQCSDAIDQAVRQCADRYRLPRWWVYVICQRESSFNVHNTDGKGLGLTQLTGKHHNGMPYPENLPAPDNDHRQWRYDMGLGKFGPWTDMANVSRLDDPKDPQQNLSRWATVHAVPAYALCARRYGLTTPSEILRRVAFHWKAGIFEEYDPGHDYFVQVKRPDGGLTTQYTYNYWEAEFRALCEAEDGVYVGPPSLEAPAPAPAPDPRDVRIAELEADRVRLARAIDDLRKMV